MIALYRFIYFLIFILVKVIYPFLPRKIKQIIDFRNIPIEFPNLGLNPIWIHAASGEFEYAKPLIREFKKQYPDKKIVVSFYSVSYFKAIKNFEGVDFCFALPWDFTYSMSSLLKKINPQMIFIARTDLWTEFIFQAKKLKIPTYLFSYYANQKSAKFRGLLKPFTIWQLNLLDTVDCASQADYDFLKQLGVTAKLKASGDTRYDQVLYRLQQSNPKIKQVFSDSPVVIYGSTWPEDEEVVLPAIKNIKASFILAPHESTATHINQIQNQLNQLQISYDLYSQLTEKSDKKVVIVDQMGVLADLYKQANIAFVGGSFKQKVHSVMEPLAAGIPVIVGPNYHNNLEAIEFSQIQIAPNTQLVTPVTTTSFEPTLKALLNQPTNHKSQIISLVQNKAGALLKILNSLS